MKNLIRSMSILLGLFAVVCSIISASGAGQRSTGTGKSFKGPIGLQLYSLRAQFNKDVPGTLEQVHNFGITYVELAGTFKLAPDEFKKQLDAKGLKPISGHFGYERFRDNVEDIAKEAKALGLQ